MNEKVKPYVNIILAALLIWGGFAGYKYVTSETQKPTNKAEIVLDDTVNIAVGQLGKLDASKSKGSTFVWTCFPEGLSYEVIGDGDKLIFSSGCVGEYTCVVSSARRGYVDQKIIKIIVHPYGYTPENPNKPVDPNTPPTPPAPVPAGLAGQIQGWYQTLTSPNKSAEAQALSGAFGAVATQIEAGTLITAQDVEVATQNATQAALGNSLTSWTPFLNNLQGYLKQERLRGTLVTVEDYVRVWREISLGLKQVKG